MPKNQNETHILEKIWESWEWDDSLINCAISGIKKLIWEILEWLREWRETDNNELIKLVRIAISSDWWEIQPSANPESKWKKIKHPIYWTFASWNVDENKEYILDENWIPLNFTFLLKQWWNLVRMSWWNIRYTGNVVKK